MAQANQLRIVELGRTRTEVSVAGLIQEDYSSSPGLHRDGIWSGLVRDFRETVLLQVEFPTEAGEESASIGWIVDGCPLDRASATGLPRRVPGTVAVDYRWPGADDRMHTIALSIAPGTAEATIRVQVVHAPAEGQALRYGPELEITLRGSVVDWPAEKLAKERIALGALADRITRVLALAGDTSGTSPERLMDARGEQADRIVAALEAAEVAPLADSATAAELAAAVTALRPVSIVARPQPFVGRRPQRAGVVAGH
ncbi:hypothetical protein [Millisia brevis]|uniref:hypothetical protein n=1 Tax=Millisia brevis TaxID=264148 RepID=UPI0012EDF3AA|nr:hypothetical protein [Millisia brevis]